MGRFSTSDGIGAEVWAGSLPQMLQGEQSELDVSVGFIPVVGLKTYTKSFKIYFIIFNCVYVSVCECRNPQRPKLSDSPGTGYEPSDMGAGSQTQDIWKTRPPSHPSSPKRISNYKPL